MLKGCFLLMVAQVVVAVPLLNAIERQPAHKDEVSCSWNQSGGPECYAKKNGSIITQSEDDLPSNLDIETACSWNEGCSATVKLSDVDVPGITSRDSILTVSDLPLTFWVPVPQISKESGMQPFRLRSR